jgi:hypothetical protein
VNFLPSNLLCSFSSSAVLLVMRGLQSKMLGREVQFIPLKGSVTPRGGAAGTAGALGRYDDEDTLFDNGPERALELAGLTTSRK